MRRLLVLTVLLFVSLAAGAYLLAGISSSQSGAVSAGIQSITGVQSDPLSDGDGALVSLTSESLSVEADGTTLEVKPDTQ
jgi:hypothetical protein